MNEKLLGFLIKSFIEGETDSIFEHGFWVNSKDYTEICDRGVEEGNLIIKDTTNKSPQSSKKYYEMTEETKRILWPIIKL